MILDSRTLQSTPESGARAGYDGAKRGKGSKVHAAVDTLGHLLALHVTPADDQDRAQVGELARPVQELTGDHVAVAYVDQGYTGEAAAEAAEQHGLQLEVVEHTEAKRGFVLLPRRGVGAPDAASGGLAQSGPGRQHAAGPVVAPFGVFSMVSRTTCSTFSSPISRVAPGRGSSPSPAMPSAMNRLRHRPTVKPVVRNFAGTAALLAPPARSKTIRARKAADRALRDCRAIRSNSALRTGLTNSSCFRPSTARSHTSP